MSTEHNTPSTFILLLSLDFKFLNIFVEDAEILSNLNVPCLILHNTHYVFSPYLCNRFTVSLSAVMSVVVLQIAWYGMYI
jgi:hypothetical protein